MIEDAFVLRDWICTLILLIASKRIFAMSRTYSYMRDCQHSAFRSDVFTWIVVVLLFGWLQSKCDNVCWKSTFLEGTYIQIFKELCSLINYSSNILPLWYFLSKISSSIYLHLRPTKGIRFSFRWLCFIIETKLPVMDQKAFRPKFQFCLWVLKSTSLNFTYNCTQLFYFEWEHLENKRQYNFDISTKTLKWKARSDCRNANAFPQSNFS